MSKVLLVSVMYASGKYVPTKAAIKMIEAAGHEVAQSPKEGVVVIEGRHLPYAKPVVPAVMAKAKELKLEVTTLDELLGLEYVEPKIASAPKPKRKPKAKGKKRASKKAKAPVQETAAAA